MTYSVVHFTPRLDIVHCAGTRREIYKGKNTNTAQQILLHTTTYCLLAVSSTATYTVTLQRIMYAFCCTYFSKHNSKSNIRNNDTQSHVWPRPHTSITHTAVGRCDSLSKVYSSSLHTASHIYFFVVFAFFEARPPAASSSADSPSWSSFYMCTLNRTH
jgi:hypothetical protein